MRVLFVDDDEAISQSIKANLCNKGHSVDTAGLGEEALHLIQGTPYDIVVLDVGLPDMDGYQIVRRMKSQQIETPVVMQSGLAEGDRIDDEEILGIEGVLSKPFSTQQLLERIESVLVHPGSPAPAPEVPPQGAPASAPELASDAPQPNEAKAGPGAERRRSERFAAIEGALITEDGKIIACVILDLSENGAQIRLALADQECPTAFTLQQLDGPCLRCEVRWRDGARMGVEFI